MKKHPSDPSIHHVVRSYSSSYGMVVDEIRKMIDCAKLEPTATYYSNFNGVDVYVNDDSNFDLIVRDWERGISKCIDAVLPYPNAELSQEELDNDKRIIAENKAKYEAQYAEMRRKDAEKKEKFKVKTSGTELKINPDKVDEYNKFIANNSSDEYSLGTMTYASDWGRLMQVEIANICPEFDSCDHDKKFAVIESIAERTSHEADLNGITGNMYGFAAGVLCRTWIYGELLNEFYSKMNK